MESNEAVFSVSQLNQQVKYLLEQSFTSILVEGEISNLSCPASGHWYFSLKDDSAQIRCAMFRFQNQKVNFDVEDGCLVVARAKVSLYPQRGDFQLIVEGLEELGAGALQRAFDELKAKLEKQGLFKEEHKKPLPALPKQIGVITSATGAAVRDIIKVLQRRFASIPVTIYPTLVQGDLAPKQIIDAIKIANKRNECDVLILARGGGSMEDLWPFNDEDVAMAIFNSQIPVVSGIGHQIDYTIADFVADVRAATPSAAAEIVVPNQQEWLQKINQLELQLLKNIMQHYQSLSQNLDWLGKRLTQLHPEKLLAEQHKQCALLQQRLNLLISHRAQSDKQRLAQLFAELQKHHPKNQLQQYRLMLNQALQQLQQRMQQQFTNKQHQCQNLMRALNSISPLATLDRGYAIVSRCDNQKVITQAREIKTGEQARIKLRKGELLCHIDSKSN